MPQHDPWFDQFPSLKQYSQPAIQPAKPAYDPWFDQFDAIKQLQPVQQVASGSEIPDPPELTGQSRGTLQKIADVLGSGGDFAATSIDQLWNKGDSVSGALSKGLKAAADMTSTTTDFDKVLENAGWEQGTKRAALGLAGDLIVDPLNFVGGAPVKMLSKAGLKLPKVVAKVAGGSDELVGAVPRILKNIGTRLEEAPIIKDIAEKFVQFPGTGRIMSQVDPTLSYRDLARLNASGQRGAREYAAEQIQHMTNKLSDKDASEIAFAMDEGRKVANPELQMTQRRLRTAIDNQVKEDLAKGSLNPKMTRQNYVPYYPGQFDNSNPALRAAYHGIAKTDALPLEKGMLKWNSLKEAAERGGAITDIREIAAKRLAEGRVANKAIEHLEETFKHFGSKTAKPGYRMLHTRSSHLNSSFYANVLKKYDSVYFPEKVAKDLERAVVLSSKETLAGNLASTAAKLWKTMALSTPGHQFTNLIGNIANMNLGGMNMVKIGKMYPKAVQWSRQLNGNIVPRFGIKGIDDGLIWKKLKEYEIVGTSTQLGELELGRTAPAIFKGKYNPISPDNAMFSGLRKGGQKYIEEPARIAFFINELEKGSSFEKAALRTKEILFDYGELTDTEHKIRQFVPFFTWTRKNLPLQLKSLLTSPERVERHKDVLEFFQNAGGGEDFAQPEYLTEAGYVPSPIKGKDGTPAMMRVALPEHDLGLIPAGLDMQSIENSGRRIGGMFAPWLKAPIELWGVNQDISTGVPIRRSGGTSAPAPLGNILNSIGLGEMAGMKETPLGMKQDDITAYLMRQIPGFTPWARGIPGVMEDDPIGGDKLNQAYSSIGSLLGLNPRLITMTNEKSEMDKRMQEWKNKVKRVLEP